MRFWPAGKYFLLLSFVTSCPIFFCPSIVFGDWTISTIDSEGNVGENTSIVLDSNDRPHIAYYDSSNSKVKYAYWTGSVWKSTLVDSGNLGKGSAQSIAIDVNGNAYIVYTYIGSGGLRLAKCTGLSCTTRQIGTIFNADEAVIALDNANNIQHIAYSDHNASNLKYVKCTDSSCSSPETVDPDETSGFDVSMALDINGIPYTSYINAQKKELRYAKKVGTSWIVELVDSNIWQGGGTSLAFDSNGKPYISYNATFGDALKIAWKDQNWQHKNIDSGGLIGAFSSLTFDKNGDFHISYYDWTNAELKYAKGTTLSWNTSTVHHTEGGQVGHDTSIAVDSKGNPHISYKDVFNFDLLYASWSAVTPVLTKPEITSVYPNPVIGANRQQWLTIIGKGFEPNLKVTLRMNSETYIIPENHVILDNANQIRIFVNFTEEPAKWGIRVSNPNNYESNNFKFDVIAPQKDITIPNEFRIQQPIKTTSKINLKQEYACFGCVKDKNGEPIKKFHTGIDINVNEINPPVLAVAKGEIVLVQENGGNLDGLSKPCGENSKPGRCEDHGYGNTVIIKHALNNGGVIYSHYSHLVEVNEVVKNACVPSPIDSGKERRKHCTNSNSNLLYVREGQEIGKVGRSGFGNPTYYYQHLHFEIKKFSTLGGGGDDEIPFGYSEKHPDKYDYLDPCQYFEQQICNKSDKVNQDGGIINYQYITRIVEVKIPANAYQTEKTVNIAQALSLPPVSPSQTNIKMLSSPIAIEINVDGNEQPTDYAIITMSFQDSDIIGLDESQLAIARYDEVTGKWEVLESSVDTLSNKVTARTKHFSVFAIVQRVPEIDLSKARVYPVPFPSPGFQEIIFNHLPTYSTLQIFNVVGERVRELDDNDGDGLITWDARNDNGENVASGTYLCKVKGSGNKKTLKAVIIR